MSQETDKQRISDISRQYFVHMKYNAVNSITDGIFFTLGTGMASGTVLTYFVSTFTSSNAVIGLLTTLHSLLVNVPSSMVVIRNQYISVGTKISCFLPGAVVFFLWFIWIIYQCLFCFVDKSDYQSYPPRPPS
ncbi:MAG: hypothetical protein JG777_433 [Clostridia bacterium]|nr:hypothetical protein [Clostridia bacterium]